MCFRRNTQHCVPVFKLQNITRAHLALTLSVLAYFLNQSRKGGAERGAGLAVAPRVLLMRIVFQRVNIVTKRLEKNALEVRKFHGKNFCVILRPDSRSEWGKEGDGWCFAGRKERRKKCPVISPLQGALTLVDNIYSLLWQSLHDRKSSISSLSLSVSLLSL